MKKIRLKRICALFLALAMAATLAAPAVAEEPDVTPPDTDGGEQTKPSFSISLPDQTLTLGSTTRVTAELTPKPANAVMSDIKYEWISSHPSIFTVPELQKNDETVTLTPVARGNTATLTLKVQANVNGESVTQTATCGVVVDYAPATSVTVLPSSQTMKVGGQFVLDTVVTGDGGGEADSSAVAWEVTSSTDDKVVQLSGQVGKSVTVTAGRAGKATVTATIKTQSGEERKANCNIIVKGIALTEYEKTMIVGETKDISATPHGDIGSQVEWSSSNDGVAFVDMDGHITAQSEGKALITARIGEYTASCEVTVKENTASTIKGEAGPGWPLEFSSILSEMNRRCKEALSGDSLRYVTNMTVPTDEGVLYYGYVSQDDTGFGVGGTEMYYYSSSGPGSRTLSKVTFVPNPEFSGTATIRYTGYGEGNKSFSGSIKVEVEGGSDVAYSTSNKTAVQFQASDFSLVCRERTGREAASVIFDLPRASRGTLYYNYSGPDQYAEPVTSGVKYNRTRSPYLDNVYFVPAEGYAGTFELGYQCIDTSGASFRGRITMTVTGNGSSGSSDGVNYSVAPGDHVTFRTSDFHNVSEDQGGDSLSYVYFELPRSSEGTLYYSYNSNSNSNSKVSADTRYYSSNRTPPSISKVSFVPAKGFTGSCSFGFTGYDVDGNRIEGQVNISVGGSGGSGQISYETSGSMPVTFVAADFNEACQAQNSQSLSYVQFRQPASREGTLYYRSGASSQKVSSAKKYYRSGSPALSNVTFVPGFGYNGTVSIPFSGYDTAGNYFGGTVKITVSGGSIVEKKLEYSVSSGSGVKFNAADFDGVCQARTGQLLDYVRFELPYAGSGVLCYQYNKTTGKYTSKATAATSYYGNGGGRSLDEVSFAAAANYSGTVEIPYTGWAKNGEKFDGTVKVQVKAPTAGAIRYSGNGASISMQPLDFRNACRVALGSELSHIQFTSLPDESIGRLYFGYESASNKGTLASAGTSYYYASSPELSRLSFVPKAGFQGRSTIAYTGVDTKGTRFSGTVELSIASGYGGSSFSDMEKYDWAKPAVEFLYQSGVVNGVGGSKYGPGQQIKRGDFVLMLCKAFQFNTGSTASFPDVPSGSYYAGAVATAKDLGIVSGSGGKFNPNSALTRQDAMVMIKKAMTQAGQYVPWGGNALSGYTDAWEVADYAKDAVSSLVELGVVSGNTQRQLKPKAPISRAEMAVILHKVLTM